MMMLRQTIIAETERSTLSKLDVEGRFLGFIIEDGANEIKVYGQTRIPGGRYEIVPRRIGGFYEKYEAKFGHDFSIQVKDVPNYTNILIHIGNYIEDTLGCLLINYAVRHDYKTDTFQGSHSTGAYLQLYELIKKAFDNKQRVFIEIDR